MAHDDNSNPPDAGQPDKDIENAVGYGRPPKKNQFKPGVSGNPNGRPKGSKSPSRILKDLLNEQVSVHENGRRKRITRFEALARQTLNNTFKGDLKSWQVFAALTKLDQQPDGAGDSAELSSHETDLIDAFLRRASADLKSPDEGQAS